MIVKQWYTGRDLLGICYAVAYMQPCVLTASYFKGHFEISQKHLNPYTAK